MRYILLGILVAMQFHSLLAQDTTLTRDELREMASESFSKSDFSSASVYYKRLLDYYPRDPAYHFYLGACKAEMEDDLSEAIRLLEFASERFSPAEVYYYLGVAYQLQAEFDKALGAYNIYDAKATRKEISHRQLDVRIKECKSGQKHVTKHNILQLDKLKTYKPDTSKVTTVNQSVKIEGTIKTEKEKPVLFPPKASADESGYVEVLNEALRIQMKSDSLVREAERLRREIADSNDWNKKKMVLAEINVLQTEADNLQNNANVIYSKARALELKFVHTTSMIRNINADTLTAYHPDKPKQTTNLVDSSKGVMRQKEVQTSKVLNEFEILDYRQLVIKPIAIDTMSHPGICYKIQVGVFSKPVEFQQFKGLSPISAEKITENGFIRYYAGIFSRIKDTELALEKVRNYGFREAFIVSFYNGKKISLIRAREIEQMLKTN
jgi:tetratricopeptide (TPR) repeat protein